MGAAWQGDKNKSAVFCTCVGKKKKKHWGSAHRVGRTAERSAFSLNVEAVRTGENVFFFVVLCLPDQRSEGSKHWGSAHRGGRTVERSKSWRTLSSCHPLLAGLAIICCQLAPKEDKIGRFGS
jgi:hypothetical protein